MASRQRGRAARDGIGQSGRPQNKGGIECHHVLLGWCSFALQHPFEDATVGGQIPSDQGFDRSALQPQSLRIQLFPPHPAPFNQPQFTRARQGRLVHASMAMDHHGSGKPEPPEGIRHRIEEIRPGHPQHLGFGGKGIDQGAEKVEHGAHPQPAAQGRQSHQGGMPARGEEKGDACLCEGLDHLVGRCLEMDAEGFEHISRTHAATGAAVAVFGHGGTTGGGGEGHGGGDVEALGAVSTGAAGIHQRHGRPFLGYGTCLAQHRGHGRQFLPIHPLGPQGSEQGAGEYGLDLHRPAIHASVPWPEPYRGRGPAAGAPAGRARREAPSSQGAVQGASNLGKGHGGCPRKKPGCESTRAG